MTAEIAAILHTPIDVIEEWDADELMAWHREAGAVWAATHGS